MYTCPDGSQVEPSDARFCPPAPVSNSEASDYNYENSFDQQNKDTSNTDADYWNPQNTDYGGNSGSVDNTEYDIPTETTTDE
jgi:hypothetical protein